MLIVPHFREERHFWGLDKDCSFFRPDRESVRQGFLAPVHTLFFLSLWQKRRKPRRLMSRSSCRFGHVTLSPIFLTCFPCRLNFEPKSLLNHAVENWPKNISLGPPQRNVSLSFSPFHYHISTVCHASSGTKRFLITDVYSLPLSASLGSDRCPTLIRARYWWHCDW